MRFIFTFTVTAGKPIKYGFVDDLSVPGELCLLSRIHPAPCLNAKHYLHVLLRYVLAETPALKPVGVLSGAFGVLC